MNRLTHGPGCEKEKSCQSKQSQLKQRKVVKKYDSKYLETGFTWNGDEEDPRPQCIICCDQLASESMCPNKLRRHFEKKHFELKDKPLEFFERILDKLKAGQKIMKRYTKVNEKSLYASCLISLRIAKAD